MDLGQVISKYEVQGSQLDDLKTYFRTMLEVTLSSLSSPIPSPDQELSNEYWDELRSRVKAPDAIAQASARLGELQTLLGKLAQFPDDFELKLSTFISLLSALDQKKSNFDKKVLSDFYQTGLQALTEKKATPDVCPFCGTTFPWDKLTSHVESQYRALDFYEIEQQHKDLLAIWGDIKLPISDRRIILSQIELSAVKEAYNLVGNTSPLKRLFPYNRSMAQVLIHGHKML